MAFTIGDRLTFAPTCERNVGFLFRAPHPRVKHPTISAILNLVADVSLRLGVDRRHIDELFRRGRLSREICPIRSGRRLIPEAYLLVVAIELARAGKLAIAPKGVAR